MKSASEHLAIEAAIYRRGELEKTQQIKKLLESALKVKEPVNTLLRDKYRDLLAAHPETVCPIQVTCDGCSTQLVDVNPSMTLTSYPPKFEAVCVGCGHHYYLPCTLRR